MSAVYVSNIIINSGENFSQIYDVYQGETPMNLTGCSAQAKLRKHPESSSYVSFTVQILDELEGKIKISISPELTVNLKSGRYVYDVLLTKPNGKKQIIIEGTALVRDGISTP